MTLAQRLLFAIGLLTVATTGAIGLGVREAWRRTEERRFRDQFQQAVEPLRREIEVELSGLPGVLEPICRHDPIVDSALVGLKADDLAARRLSLSLRVQELAKAYKFNELYLITHAGEILGAHQEGLVGKRDRELSTRIAARKTAELRRTPAPLAADFACLRRDDVNPRIWVGLYAARHVEPLLERIGAAYNVSLELDRPPSADTDLAAFIRLDEFGDVTLTATRSRMPLLTALEDLDTTIFGIAGVTFLTAALFALLLSRRIAQPMVELANQTREVVHGEPKPVLAKGPKEIVELANAFNQTIADLTQLRNRLAATERIAARREIARRVAHEIKNPLAPIRAAVETLRRLKARDDPAFDEYFDEASRTVLDEVMRISNIVSEFTRFARLPPPNPAPIDLVETVRSVVTLYAGGVAPPRLVSEPCKPVNADRDQIVQIMTNLIQNAEQAVQGRADPKVIVNVRPSSSDKVEIIVRDNGPGLAPEVRGKLFEPYVTTKPDGTGLGLAIVQRMVVEHGGEISYADAPSGGAEFRIELFFSGPTLLAEAPEPTSER